jgi:hypothetical protein
LRFQHPFGRRALLLALYLAAVPGCAPDRAWVLPDPDEVTGWYGEGTEASLDGNLLEIRGTVEPEHLERGGRIWARSSPYYYLFNVHVRALFQDYPDLAAVRARTFDVEGEEIARATLLRSEMTGPRWDEALARTSLAQQEGTRSPRLVERLTRFGEENTRFEYGEAAE